MGIDPGTFNMGVGVVESDDGELRLAHSELLTAARRQSLAQRLGHMHRELDRAIRELSPAQVAIEEPFVARNVRAAMAVGYAQAVAMVAADSHGLPTFSYSPRQVKKAVTDYGGSSKEQVQEMVRVLLGLPEPPQPHDTTDALAVAICHINASRGLDALEIRP